MTSDGAPQSWEERWHPLREEWVIVAAHRQQRPWTGETVASTTTRPPAHDPRCHLCPVNMRISGVRNADYTGTFVFDNDHPCVGPDAPEASRRRPTGRSTPRTSCSGRSSGAATLRIAELVWDANGWPVSGGP